MNLFKNIVLTAMVMGILTLDTFPFIKNRRILSIAETFIITSGSALIGSELYSYYYQSGNIHPKTKTALEKILQKKGLLKPGEQQKIACGAEWANLFNTIYVPQKEADAMKLGPITSEQSSILLHEKGHADYHHTLKQSLFGAALWTGCIEAVIQRPTYFRLFSLPASSYLVHKKVSRIFEKQADDFMIQHATDSELKSAIKFFERRVTYEPKSLFGKLISTHPTSSERIANIQKAIDRRKKIS